MHCGPSPDCILPRATNSGRDDVGKMREVHEVQGREEELSQNLFIKQKCFLSENPESLHSSCLSPRPLKLEGAVFFQERGKGSRRWADGSSTDLSWMASPGQRILIPLPHHLTFFLSRPG